MTLALLPACSSSVEAPLGQRKSPILGGELAPELTGVVAIAHLDAAFLCAGTVIHPRLVVTALHCTVIAVEGEPDIRLARDRFRVGFGASESSLSYISSVHLSRPRGNATAVEHVAAGEDIALLWLDEPVPAGTMVHPVDFDFVPQRGDVLTLVGYGRSSSSEPIAGEKRKTVDDAFQFDEESGVFRMRGSGACEGDSGGPVLWGEQARWVGLISQSAFESSTTASFAVECSGLTDAATVKNATVSRMIREGLEEATARTRCEQDTTTLAAVDGGMVSAPHDAGDEGREDLRERCWSFDVPFESDAEAVVPGESAESDAARSERSSPSPGEESRVGSGCSVTVSDRTGSFSWRGVLLLACWFGRRRWGNGAPGAARRSNPSPTVDQHRNIPPLSLALATWVVVLVLAGCNATDRLRSSGFESDSGVSVDAVDAGHHLIRVRHGSTEDLSILPPPSEPTGPVSEPSAPDAGSAEPEPEMPPPELVSTACGDSIRGSDEECDDGESNDSPLCTRHCTTADTTVLVADPGEAMPRHWLSEGRHPIAASSSAVAVAFLQESSSQDALSSPPDVAVRVLVGGFDASGQRLPVFDVGAEVARYRRTSRVLLDSAPSLAPLPDGQWAVAFTDLGGDGDGRGVVLANVEDLAGESRLFTARYASESGAYAQRDVDLLWVGDRLIVAWVDDADAQSASDVRYREFSARLEPFGRERGLSGTAAGDPSFVLDERPALTRFGAGWAVGWRASEASGRETIEVRASLESGNEPSVSWSVGPHWVSPERDAPVLVPLDERYVLVVFATSQEPELEDTAPLGRLSAALLDAQAPGEPVAVLEVAEEQLVDAPGLSQFQPTAVVHDGAGWVGFATREVGALSPLGDEVWLAPFDVETVSGEVTVSFEAAVAMPRGALGRYADQTAPALAEVPPWWFEPFAHPGAIALAWTDDSAGTGQLSRPHVTFELGPEPFFRGPLGCAPESPCAYGDGVCESDIDCQPGLLCTADAGESVGLPPGSAACIPEPVCIGPVLSEQDELIDDFEDGDGVILEVDGRTGEWFAYNSGGGTMSPVVNDFQPEAGGPECSTEAAHSVGSGFALASNGGYAGIGFQFTEPESAYDVSACQGIAFDGFGSGIRFAFATPATLDDHNHFGLNLSTLGGEWQRHELLFSDLAQEAWGDNDDTLDLTQGMRVLFQSLTPEDFDYSIDNVALLGCSDPSAEDPFALLDDGEDGNGQIDLSNDRDGYWYSFNSGTPGTQSPSGDFVMTSGGAQGSAYAAATSGSNFAVYAGIGFNLLEPQMPYDFSGYCGIEFYARGTGFRVKFPIPATQDDQDDFGFVISNPGSDFTHHTVEFGNVAKEGWGDTGDVFDSSVILAVQFQALNPGSFDYAVDEVRLLACD